MANVEVQLDVKAEYKQALAAIAMLGKALDEVQRRAKVALTTSGGQTGNQGSGDSEEKQKAAVEALSAAMKEAAAAAAEMATNIQVLAPALEAMGPKAEQVQQVTNLAEQYKALAAAMGVAADAAAKYNASGAQQGETDARIKQLMEENQQLVEMVMAIREEYAAIVRRNAELNRTREEREANNKEIKEELEVTQDLSYVMQLAAMSKRELTAEIERLTKARKEAAKAGDDSKYQELTEELNLARQAMTKLRQEQQLAKIAWLQEAQVAGQLAGQIEKVTGGVMDFGDALQEGTVDLAGMAEGAMSFASSLKAGLGPIGWVMLALEGLSAAINWYVKKQKEAEEAEKKRQEKIAKVTAAYIEAREAVKDYQDQQAKKDSLNALVETLERINEQYRIGKELLDESYRIEIARRGLFEDEEQHQFTLKKNEIERLFIQGKLTDEQRAESLDALKLEQAKAKQKNVSQRADLNIKTAQSEAANAEGVRNRLKWELNQLDKSGKKYATDEYSISEIFAALDLARTHKNEAYEKWRTKGRKDEDWASYVRAKEYEGEIDSELFEILGWVPHDIEHYKRERESFNEKREAAENALNTAEKELEASQQKVREAQQKKKLEEDKQAQEVRQVEELNVDAAKTRKARQEAKARKEQEKERLRIEKEEDKIMQKYADSIEAAEWSVAKGNKSRFKGKNASAVNWLLNTALPAAADGEMTSKQLATLIKAWEQAQKTKSKTDDEMVRVIANMLNDQKISDKKTRQKITAIRKNLR